MTFFEIAASLSQSLPAKVFAALGIGWVSFESYQTIIDNLINDIITNYNSIPAAAYQILSLAGFTDGIGILLGAFAAKSVLFGLKTLGNVSAGSSA